MAARPCISTQHAPGDRVPASGVYRVIHQAHRGDHPVLALKGELFPTCRSCKNGVRFELWTQTEYVLSDWDLGGDASSYTPEESRRAA